MSAEPAGGGSREHAILVWSPAPAGCSAATSSRRSSARGHEAVGLDARRARHHRRPARSRTRSPSCEPDAVVNCAAWTDVDGAEAHERARDGGQRHRRRAARRPPPAPSAPRSSTPRATTSSTAPRARRTSSPTCRLRCRRYGRSKLGRRDLGRRRQPAPLHRPLVVAVRRRRQELRRDDAAPRRRAARGARRLRPGRLPHLHAASRRRRSRCWSSPRSTASTTSPPAGAARGSTSRRRSSTRRASERRVMAATHRDARAPGSAPAYSVLAQRAPRPDRAPRLAQGLAEYLAEREARGPRHETSWSPAAPASSARAYVRHRLEAHPGDSVRVLDKLTYAGRRENLEGLDDDRVELVVGDIADPEAVRAALEGCDAIVNFAAESHVDRSIESPGEFIQTDVFGTFVLLEAARDAGIRHLQVSTDEVYGSIEEGSFTESSPLDPSSPYSASKAGGDLIVGAYPPHLRRRRADRPRLEQLRPAPAPGEADPALHPQRARRRPAAGLRRRDAGPQLALRRATSPRRSTSCSSAASRARSTTSAGPTSCRTSRSSSGSSS